MVADALKSFVGFSYTLEGDVVVGDALVGVVGLTGWRTLVEAGRAGLGVAAAAAFAAATGCAAEEGQFVTRISVLYFFLPDSLSSQERVWILPSM